MNGDYYVAILGVTKSATPEEIKAAYRELSMSLHPDRNPRGAVLMQAVNEAYEVLGDASKRAAYDRGGKKVREMPKAEPAHKEYWANEGGTINLVYVAASVTPAVMRGEVLPLISQLLGNVVKDPKAATVKELSGLVSNFIRPKKGRVRRSA